MENLHFASLPAVLVLGMVGAPLWFRRTGYPWGKTVFGSITVLAAMLGAWGILANIRSHLDWTALPVGWLVPLATAAAAWHWRERRD